MHTDHQIAAYGIMNLYFLSSPSHNVLQNDWFLPSIQDDFSLVQQDVIQLCPDGTYRSPGFREMMAQKVDLIIRAIHDNPKEVFLYSDVDVQLFRSIQEDVDILMTGRDLLLLRDSPRGVICPGFLAGRGTDNMLRLWSEIRESLCGEGKKDDQDYLNEHLLGQPTITSLVGSRFLYRLSGRYWPVRYRKSSEGFGVRWDYLPPRYYCFGAKAWRKWGPGDSLNIPRDIAVHHANWVYGIDGKIQQLRAVKNEVRRLDAI